MISHWYIRYYTNLRRCTISVCQVVYKCTCIGTAVLQCLMNSSVAPNVTTLVLYTSEYWSRAVCKQSFLIFHKLYTRLCIGA